MVQSFPFLYINEKTMSIWDNRKGNIEIYLISRWKWWYQYWLMVESEKLSQMLQENKINNNITTKLKSSNSFKLIVISMYRIKPTLEILLC